MKQVILGCLVLTLGLGLRASLTYRHWNKGVSVRTNDDSLSDDCSAHLQVYGREYQSVVRDEESRSLPNRPLNLFAEQNGGIHISTWDRPDFSVKLCKQVASDSDDQGRKILAQTRLSVNGDTVSVDAPHRDDDYNLSTLLLVKAPRDAQVSMKVENGGISVRRFTGTAEARATNGGISLKESQGKLNVRAENGGISIKDCGGDVTAEVENGGLSISLADHWDGKGLEAHTENGGLVINIPRNFSSGLEISGSEHVSIICKGDACENGQRTWDNGHRMFRLGSGNPQIKATTVNGGIVIENRDHSQDSI